MIIKIGSRNILIASFIVAEHGRLKLRIEITAVDRNDIGFIGIRIDELVEIQIIISVILKLSIIGIGCVVLTDAKIDDAVIGRGERDVRRLASSTREICIWPIIKSLVAGSSIELGILPGDPI